MEICITLYLHCLAVIAAKVVGMMAVGGSSRSCLQHNVSLQPGPTVIRSRTASPSLLHATVIAVVEIANCEALHDPSYIIILCTLHCIRPRQPSRVPLLSNTVGSLVH